MERGSSALSSPTAIHRFERAGQVGLGGRVGSDTGSPAPIPQLPDAELQRPPPLGHERHRVASRPDRIDRPAAIGREDLGGPYPAVSGVEGRIQQVITEMGPDARPGRSGAQGAPLAHMLVPRQAGKVNARPAQQAVVDDRAPVELEEAQPPIARVALELADHHPSQPDPPRDLQRRLLKRRVVCDHLRNPGVAEPRRALTKLPNQPPGDQPAATIQIGAVGVDVAVGARHQIEYDPGDLRPAHLCDPRG